MIDKTYSCGCTARVFTDTDVSGPCPSCRAIAFHRALAEDRGLQPRYISYQCGHWGFPDCTADEAETLAAGLCGHCRNRTENPTQWAADEASSAAHLEDVRILQYGTEAERFARWPERYHYDDEYDTIEQVGGYRMPGPAGAGMEPYDDLGGAL